jgi:hypothetical protein
MIVGGVRPNPGAVVEESEHENFVVLLQEYRSRKQVDGRGDKNYNFEVLLDHG